MASIWLTTRAAKDGSKRFRVEFRAGGREAPTQYGGSFKRKADAEARRRWIVGELAALRVPDIRQVAQAAPATLRTVAEAWQRHASTWPRGQRRRTGSRSAGFSPGSATRRSPRSRRRRSRSSSPTFTPTA